jgi:hypothetical protein
MADRDPKMVRAQFLDAGAGAAQRAIEPEIVDFQFRGPA